MTSFDTDAEQNSGRTLWSNNVIQQCPHSMFQLISLYRRDTRTIRKGAYSSIDDLSFAFANLDRTIYSFMVSAICELKSDELDLEGLKPPSLLSRMSLNGSNFWKTNGIYIAMPVARAACLLKSIWETWWRQLIGRSLISCAAVPWFLVVVNRNWGQGLWPLLPILSQILKTTVETYRIYWLNRSSIVISMWIWQPCFAENGSFLTQSSTIFIKPLEWKDVDCRIGRKPAPSVSILARI